MPTINRLKKSYSGKRKSLKNQTRQKIYQSVKWKELRAAKLMESPLCEMCLEKDIITPAVDVHHIRSPFDYSDINQINALAYDYSNLKSLCKQCHSHLHNPKKEE